MNIYLIVMIILNSICMGWNIGYVVYDKDCRVYISKAIILFILIIINIAAIILLSMVLINY